MSESLQTKCKHILGVLDWFLIVSDKDTFSKKQYGFSPPLLTPPPPWFGKRPYFFTFFSSEPSPKLMNNYPPKEISVTDFMINQNAFQTWKTMDAPSPTSSLKESP